MLLLPWQTGSIADDPALYSADTSVDTSGQVWSARLHSLDAERLGTALRAVRDLNGPVAALALPDEPERTLEIRQPIATVRTPIYALGVICSIPWHRRTWAAEYKKTRAGVSP